MTETTVQSTPLEQQILTREARIGVVGLGYVGLPFLVEKAKVGFHVTGFDRNEQRAQQVRTGQNYISDVKDEELRDVVERGLVDATTDMTRLADMDVIVICVPTPLDQNLSPDLSFVRSVTEEIARHIRPGQLISLESTTYPGTTEDVLKPILERSGLKAGQDFYLAHSPERVDPGNKRYSTKNTNKVVGGNDPESLRVAVTFYQQAIEHIVPVSSAKAAEMVKVYENTFRAVNIALANEIALLCDRMGLNVWEVLDAAFTKPFGIMPFYPGPGVGGHCIPLDPHYLEWKAREYNFQTHFIALAGETNRKMPEFVVEKAARVLNMDRKALNGSRVLLLGMAYKGDLDDYRESPAIHIYRLLQEASADVIFHDTWTPEVNEHGVVASSVDLTDDLLDTVDLVIITTQHSDVDYQNVVNRAQRVLDTRNATRTLSGKDRVVML
ncbi:nucleotide sugar dehydrogenase [Deinococcus knuensis]|uniref:UDP-N-acetyl-D-glucosamine dehydrogenase n=1 Tax=Deinococcus knuensis TaxID=1837380 RepID=A0ABQ2SPL4_9DEIO|nr:nucleotide sugar dehydrogenase [Deinococcus knuensis]GGS36115.1 UDP-N-acetyl-D-glucosamine dehydrogenase [Deinococcus knuensis]